MSTTDVPVSADPSTLRRLIEVDALKAAASWRAHQERLAALARLAQQLGLADADVAAALVAAGLPADALAEAPR